MHSYAESQAKEQARHLWKHLVAMLRAHTPTHVVATHLEIGRNKIEQVQCGSLRAYWLGSWLLGIPPSELCRGGWYAPRGVDHTPPPTNVETAALWESATAKRKAQIRAQHPVRLRLTYTHRTTRPSLIRVCRVGPALWGTVAAAFQALEHERRQQH